MDTPPSASYGLIETPARIHYHLFCLYYCKHSRIYTFILTDFSLRTPKINCAYVFFWRVRKITKSDY
jgi:hypothetical protein